MSKPIQVSMNLPVHNHLARLCELVDQMRIQADQAEKDLHILRGCISQLSFINKQSDQDLNQYLLSSINMMRNKWATEWDDQHSQLVESHKKVQKIITEHQDIQLKRQQLQEKVAMIQQIVGLI